MGVLLAMLTLVSCQTLKPIDLPAALNRPCPEFDFTGGELMPQVIRLKTEFELCKVNNNALIELLLPD